MSITHFAIRLSFVVMIGASILACSQPPANSSIRPSPSPVSTADTNNIDTQAGLIVGADDGGKAPATADDARTVRVRYLLGVLVAQAKETPFNIAAAVDALSGSIEKQFGKKISRQQLLEDLADAYSSKTIKPDDGKFKDAAMLWAQLKYGK